MNIGQFFLTALLCTFVVLMLKNVSKDYAIFASIASSVVLIFYAVSSLSNIYGQITAIFSVAKIPIGLLKPCLKVIALGYLTEFTANLISDSGEKSIADKVRLFGKISIFASTLPLISKFIDVVLGIL